MKQNTEKDITTNLHNLIHSKYVQAKIFKIKSMKRWKIMTIAAGGPLQKNKNV